MIQWLKSKFPDSAKYKIKKLLLDEKYNFILDEKVNVKKELKQRKEVIVSTDMLSFEAYYDETRKADEEYEQLLDVMDVGLEHTKIIINPYGHTPLSALALFRTNAKVSVRVVVSGKEQGDDYVREVTAPSKSHRVAIFGLYPEYSNTVRIDLIDQNKTVESRTFLIVTPPIDKRFDDAVQVEKHTAKSSVPFMLVSGKSVPYPFAFDDKGNVRYVLNLRPSGYGMLPISGGKYILIERRVMIPTYQYPYSTQFYEIDLLGRVYRTYHVPKGAHHDICEMSPGGNFLTITNSNQGHIGDVIIEIDRTTGEIVKRLNLKTIIDKKFCDMIGWAHVNTLDYDNENGILYFCARNLHSVIKLDWKKNNIEWILGDPAFWKGSMQEMYLLKTKGEVEWSYQPHSPYHFASDGEKENIIIFDNHWAKRRPVDGFVETEDSYVKIYEINTAEKTVTMAKKYTTVKSKITSNPLLIEDERVFAIGAFLEPRIENRGGMIDEFDYDSGELLNRYSIRYFFYRGYPFEPDLDKLSERFPEAEYPAVGFLYKPQPVSKSILNKKRYLLEALPEEEREKMEFRCTNKTLFLNAKDHQVEKVFFEGQKRAYYRDYSWPPQTETRSEKMWYYHAIPLYMLKPDTYRIVLQINKKLYDTGKTFTIKSGS